MRLLANLFLILFLADGGISLLDDLLTMGLRVELLSGLRNLVAFAVLLLAVPLYLALGIDRRLPKLVFMPLIGFVAWASFALWPLPALFEETTLRILASGGQLLLGAMAMVYLRRTAGETILLSREMFLAPRFSLRNTLGFAAGNIFILPVALLFFGFSTTSFYLDKQTAGFLRLSPQGIYMSERVYRHADKTIRLAGMVHIGEQDYYRDIADSVQSGRTIVLAEGVSDEDNLLTHRLDYGPVGDALGMVSQQELQFHAELIDLERIDAPEWAVDPGVPHIARADIDLNRFDPRTVEFLNVLGSSISSGGSLAEGLKRYNAWAEEHITPELVETLMEDILHKRNEAVIQGMNRSLRKYDTVFIPWGAMHMPGIEAAVLEKGFSLQQSRERLSLDFGKVPLAELLQKLSSSPQG